MRRRGVGFKFVSPTPTGEKKGTSALRNRTWAAEGQGPRRARLQPTRECIGEESRINLTTVSPHRSTAGRCQMIRTAMTCLGFAALIWTGPALAHGATPPSSADPGSGADHMSGLHQRSRQSPRLRHGHSSLHPVRAISVPRQTGGDTSPRCREAKPAPVSRATHSRSRSRSRRNWHSFDPVLSPASLQKQSSHVNAAPSMAKRERLSQQRAAVRG